jgi:hypothetical protein
MDISLHSTVRLLQRSDTSVLTVSAAFPACLCVRTSPQPHTSEYVRREFKSMQERRRDAARGRGRRGTHGSPFLGVKGFITPQTAIMNDIQGTITMNAPRHIGAVREYPPTSIAASARIELESTAKLLLPHRGGRPTQQKVGVPAVVQGSLHMLTKEFWRCSGGSPGRSDCVQVASTGHPW